MPFQELSKMHLRKQMVKKLREGQLSVSDAAREYGVSRNTVRLWRSRAQECPIRELTEFSRRPHRVWRQTDIEIELEILALKAQRPAWGAKKIVAKLWPENSPICVRTADRILARHGLTRTRGEREDLHRFERGNPNELWQIDFKGMGRRRPYSPLSVLDDMSRFAICLRPLPDHRTDTIFDTLWDLFGEFGLPDRILSDNESCFADVTCRGPSRLEVRLWLLGIDSSHGRPYHPQTQGKVERFHRTVKDELGEAILQKDIGTARAICERFIHDYNFERPNEAIGMKVPADLYRPSARKRPAKMPEHEIPQGAIARKVDSCGRFLFKSKEYHAGYGLIRHYVQLKEEPDGFGVWFAGRRFASLDDLKV
jgi:transposase InsO family protein